MALSRPEGAGFEAGRGLFVARVQDGALDRSGFGHRSVDPGFFLSIAQHDRLRVGAPEGAFVPLRHVPAGVGAAVGAKGDEVGPRREPRHFVFGVEVARVRAGDRFGPIVAIGADLDLVGFRGDADRARDRRGAGGRGRGRREAEQDERGKRREDETATESMHRVSTSSKSSVPIWAGRGGTAPRPDGTASTAGGEGFRQRARIAPADRRTCR